MPSVRVLPPEIEQALARGATILTANQRAARTLRRAFDLHQRDRGLDLWEPPQILAWETWTHSLWDRLLLDGHASELLLSPAQEHTIWRAIIAADTSTASLRPVDALARTAADAWKRLHDYRGRNRLQSFPGNSDTRAFARWATEFERRCARAHYLSEALLLETLRDAIVAGCFFTAELVLVGFDSKTPAQTALLDAILANSGVAAELDLPALAPNLTLVDSPNEQGELAACALWLRARLTENPDTSIAIIVPQIDPTRAEIDRVFRNILAPELEDIAAPVSSGPFEFSLGVPLARTPIVSAALDILRWSLGPLSLDRTCALLLSPHFAAVEDSAEHIARAEFDTFAVRGESLLQPQITVDALYRLAAGWRHNARLPVLQNHLRALRTLLSNRDHIRGDRTHAEWAAAIHELLEAAGWAPTSQLDSIEFQTRSKWDSALDELATLDFDGVRVSFKDALAALERIAAETLFAPESRHAPIQIMGPLESAGSAFDALWFLRANDLEWPANPSPNPLLPWLLQREFAMSGVDPARDTAQARRITERIAASAPAVLFSYAKQSSDNRQRPSPILAGLALECRPAADVATTPPIVMPIVLERFADEAPIPPPPDCVLQGGASILQSQAACGFRAFAEKRLFASAPDTTTLGLDARERGSLVHAVLERFWAVVGTQSALKQMTTDARNVLLARSIDDALAEHHAHPEPGWPTTYLAAERQRLLNLLDPWIDYEAKERAPFTVKSREESLPDVRIGPLRLDIRVDRVDEVYAADSTAPAGELILDYKTGEAKPADWLGPRPDAPQLPLYAVVADKPNLAAIAFASIRRGNLMGMAGYETGRSGILPKPAKLKASSLAAQVDEWHGILTSLAEEFHAGNASVSPKHYPQTCQYCEQRLLCRLNPFSLDPDVLEEIDEESDNLEENDFA
jgi:probable DNA repair protein